MFENKHFHKADDNIAYSYYDSAVFVLDQEGILPEQVYHQVASQLGAEYLLELKNTPENMRVEAIADSLKAHGSIRTPDFAIEEGMITAAMEHLKEEVIQGEEKWKIIPSVLQDENNINELLDNGVKIELASIKPHTMVSYSAQTLTKILENCHETEERQKNINQENTNPAFLQKYNLETLDPYNLAQIVKTEKICEAMLHEHEREAMDNEKTKNASIDEYDLADAMMDTGEYFEIEEELTADNIEIEQDSIDEEIQ